MKQIILFIFLVLQGTMVQAQSKKAAIASPDGLIKLSFTTSKKGEPLYAVTYGTAKVVNPSVLGFELKEGNFSQKFKVLKSETSTFDETWTPVWGQYRNIRNNYNELLVHLKDDQGRLLDIRFKVYNDGVGFRYELPTQAKKEFIILNENTQFAMTSDHTCWWVPGCWENDEYPYTQSTISTVDATEVKKISMNTHAMYIDDLNGVNTPFTMRTQKRGLHITVHEAALVNYPGLSLKVDRKNLILTANIAANGDGSGIRATVPCPFNTPWRTIQIGVKAADLLASQLILNLNEPCKIKDVSWIKPQKYAGIWWEMHLGKSTWDFSGAQSMDSWTKKVPTGKHGATTENAMRYIDFCAANGIPGLLIEGWNTGWEFWTGKDRENVFDFTTPYPDFDIEKVVAYGKSKGVGLIGHHETAMAPATYEKHMDAAYEMYEKLGIHGVKSGYVFKDPKHYHYDQWMVNHYNRTMEKCADHKLMLDIHEPIHQTGLCRTYPNLVAAEGMRGQEYNAWSVGNPPVHTCILPFTRNMAGPMDYTPGIFDIKLKRYKNAKLADKDIKESVHSTIANQLALYVVFYSPIQMAADVPENYEGNPAFQFIRDVVTDWDDTKVLEAEIAESVVMARKAKGENKWFVGGVTNEKERTSTVDFSFLPEGNFEAIVYKDGAKAHYDTNPTDINIERVPVTNKSTFPIKMASGGGFAISVMPVK